MCQEQDYAICLYLTTVHVSVSIAGPLGTCIPACVVAVATLVATANAAATVATVATIEARAINAHAIEAHVEGPVALLHESAQVQTRRTANGRKAKPNTHKPQWH